MTTIAVRAGVIAADSRETWGEDDGCRVFNKCSKLIHVPEFNLVIGQQGLSAPGDVATDWYITNERSRRANPMRRTKSRRHHVEPPEFVGDEEFVLLILREEGVFVMDCWLRPQQVHDDYFAIGSGTKVALGAMYMGATAVQAVEAACQFDPYTGGKVVSFSLANLGSV